MLLYILPSVSLSLLSSTDHFPYSNPQIILQCPLANNLNFYLISVSSIPLHRLLFFWVCYPPSNKFELHSFSLPQYCLDDQELAWLLFSYTGLSICKVITCVFLVVKEFEHLPCLLAIVLHLLLWTNISNSFTHFFLFSFLCCKYFIAKKIIYIINIYIYMKVTYNLSTSIAQ